MMRTRRTGGLLMGALFLLVGALTPAAAQPFTLEPESRLWIEGTSTVNTFTCEAEEVEGRGQLGEGGAQASLAAPVQRFDCGKDRMNRDLYEAMKAEAHPLIQFRLEEATVRTAPEESDGWYALEAEGHLTLAGTERPVRVTARGRRLPDGRLQVVGRHGLRMSDFGIEPPTALMGLVKAHDAITVHFDLLAAPQDGAHAQNW